MTSSTHRPHGQPAGAPHTFPDSRRPAQSKLSDMRSKLYTIDSSPDSLRSDPSYYSPRPSRTADVSPSSSPFSVKEEPDDEFIMEFADPLSMKIGIAFEHLVPPTEVPLRATQASKEMRKMMGVFRLNPFSMHHGGGRGTAAPLWNGEEAGPLEHEPRLYEFQLDGFETSVAEDELRSFSPEFEVDSDGSPDVHDMAAASAAMSAADADAWDEYDMGDVNRSSSGWQPPAWEQSADVYTSPTGTSTSLELEYPNSTVEKMHRTFPLSIHIMAMILMTISNSIDVLRMLDAQLRHTWATHTNFSPFLHKLLLRGHYSNGPPPSPLSRTPLDF